jgi:DNA-binding CsgD family transcriptional regulator
MRKEVFWSQVDKTSSCWIWTGAKTGRGYGTFRVNRKQRAVHRLSYELHHGPIPEEKMICHHCDTPLCINPNHLFLGDAKLNDEDMRNKNRQPNLSGQRNGHSSLTSEKVQKIRQLYKEGQTQLQIAKRFKIQQPTVSKIVRRIRWAHLPDIAPI